LRFFGVHFFLRSITYDLRPTTYDLRGNYILCPGAFGEIPVNEAGEAFGHGDLGLPGEGLAGFGDVGDVGEDIGFVEGYAADIGLLVEAFFEHLDDLVDGEDFVAAEVEDFITEGLEAEDGAAGDIVDVGEAAGLAAIACDEDFAAFGDPLAEAEDGHVGAAGGAVDGEVAEDGDVEVVEVMVGVGHDLGAFFAGGVGLEGMVGVVGFFVGVGATIAVEAGGGGEDEFRAGGLAAVFEHVEGAGGVGFQVEPGVFDAAADAGDGGEVDDGGGGCGEEVFEGLDGFGVGNVEVGEVEAGDGLEAGEAVVFDADIVGGGEVVDAEDGVAGVEEEGADAGGDETGGASY